MTVTTKFWICSISKPIVLAIVDRKALVSLALTLAFDVTISNVRSTVNVSEVVGDGV